MGPKKQSQLPPLHIPKGLDWKVKVTAVSKANTVFVRFCEYEKEYKEMVELMLNFYPTYLYKVATALSGCLYVAVSKTKAARVHVLDVSNGNINCYFIDSGFSRQLKISALREMNDQFMKLPPQAFEFELHSVDDNEEAKTYVSKIVNDRVDKEFVAKLNRRLQGKYSVELYFDIKDELSDENSLNVSVSRFTRRQAIEKLLAKSDSYVEVYVTHCEIKDGDCLVSVQINEQYLDKLNSNQERINNSCERFGVPLNESMVPHNGVYYIKYEEQWRRVKIVNIDKQMALAYFVDHGNTDVVELCNIRKIEPLMDLNRFLPFLAHTVTLVPKGSEWTESDTLIVTQFFSKSIAKMEIVTAADESQFYALVNIFKSIMSVFDVYSSLNSTTRNLANTERKTHSKDINTIFFKTHE